MGDRVVYIFVALCVGLGIGYGVGRRATPPVATSEPASPPVAAPTSAPSTLPAPEAAQPEAAVASQPAPAIVPLTDPDFLPKDARELPEAIRSRLPGNAFALNHAPIQGDLFKAKVAVIMFGDLQCPYCAQARTVLPELRKEFGDDVVVAWRHFPIPGHDLAPAAARAAIAAQKQGKFWEFQERVLMRQEGLTEERLRDVARDLSLDLVKFDTDRASEETSALLEVDRILGSSMKVDGTPTFMVNGRKLVGALPYETVREAVISQRSVVESRIGPGRPVIQARGEVSEESLKAESAVGDEQVPRQRVMLDGAPVRGPADALVTVVVFADFQCPFCATMAPLLDKLIAEWPSDVRVAFRNLPLAIHEHAHDAAVAARFAFEVGGAAKFWAVHDKLFAAQDKLGREDLLATVKGLGLDATELATAFRTGRFGDTVDADAALSAKLRVATTPTLAINGKIFPGASDWDALRKHVEEAMAEARTRIAKGALRTTIYETILGDIRE